MKITKNLPKEVVLELGKKECKNCTKCCEFSSGFLAEGDLKELSTFLGMKEEEVKEKYLEEAELFNKKLLRPKMIRKGKPYGRCIFLKKNGCSVHPARPLMCRLGTCDNHGEDLHVWFKLNHVLDLDDPESVRQFAAYLRSGGKTIPGGTLVELFSDKEKLRKILNYEILK